MNECNTAVHGYTTRSPLAATRRMSLNDLRGGQRESLAWLAQYNLAVAQGVPRQQLLEIFDATYECVMAYFFVVEALLEQTCWSCFKQHRALHSRFAQQLSAYREGFVAGDTLDPQESPHALDGLLIHFTREQDLFKRLDARLGRVEAGRGHYALEA
jgi:hypothetical protein